MNHLVGIALLGLVGGLSAYLIVKSIGPGMIETKELRGALDDASSYTEEAITVGELAQSHKVSATFYEMHMHDITDNISSLEQRIFDSRFVGVNLGKPLFVQLLRETQDALAQIKDDPQSFSAAENHLQTLHTQFNSLKNSL